MNVGNSLLQRTATTTFFAASAILVGCTVGPDFRRPETPATGYRVETAVPNAPQGMVYGGDIADDWYRLFHSDALNGLVRQALSGNPDLEAARHGLAAAQYELLAVSGAALPELDGTANAQRTHINGSYLYGQNNALGTTANRFAIGPTLSYNLDLFGGVRRGVEAQAAATASTRDQALNTYITLVNQVVAAAFDYAAVAKQIEVTHSLIDEFQQQYELTEKLEAAGKITRADTLQAQTQLETARATLPTLEEQRDTYRNALARLCGQAPDAFAMPALGLKDFSLPAQLPVSLPSTLVRQRPDILAAEESLHQASAQVGVADADRLPSLILSAQYSQQSITLNQLFTQPGGVWSVAANLTAPLFDGGTRKARAEEARERYQQASAVYRSAVIGAFVDVANALEALRHDGDSYDAHGRALNAAHANRDLALAQYKAGKYGELEVLTAEQQYQNAALSQVQADAQRFTDTAALFHALGGGWWSAPTDPTAAAPVAADATPMPAASGPDTARATKD